MVWPPAIVYEPANKPGPKQTNMGMQLLLRDKPAHTATKANRHGYVKHIFAATYTI